MHQVSKLQITKLNPHLTCLLCGGYFIEATTIIECLHSFCKSCIVRYLETNKFCPVCEVQVHKTKPLLNIRSDQTLQDIVYKLVPGLFQHEMRLRREFYSKHPNDLPSNPEDRGEVTDHFIYSSDETICLSLEYADNIVDHKEDVEDVNDNQLNGKRFLRCPAAVTVGLLKRLIRGKYGLDTNHALDILCGDSFLCDEYSLVDLAYIYNWRRKGPMRLKYRIYQKVQNSTSLTNGTCVNEELPQKIPTTNKQETLDEEKKITNEVQLEISETGIMSVLNVVARNGITEDIDAPVSSSVSEKTERSDEKNSPSPKPEPGIESAPIQIPALSPPDISVNSKPETPVDCATSIDVKTGVPDEVKKASDVSESSTAATTEIAGNSSVSHPIVSVRNKLTVSTNHKTPKPSPTSWNQSANRVGIKRTSNSVTSNDSCNTVSPEQSHPTPAKRAAPSSPSKAPRFFKVRNSSQSGCSDSNGMSCKVTGTSIASVTESPVQEVAVNLTKASSSPKKAFDKDRSLREGKTPSPRPEVSTNPIRPYSVPTVSQSKRQPSPSLAAEDAAARLKHLLNPISSASGTTTSQSSRDSSIQPLRFPAAAWLNLARGVPNRPAPLTLASGSPFSNRPPISPAHFISSFIASHPHYPYLSPLGLPPPPDGKKSLPSSTASSSSSSSSSSAVSQQTHKSTSPRTSNNFPTPTFNLNALQQCTYPSSLSPLLPNLPRELVGSFYHSSYVPRPFMSNRGSPHVSPKSLSSSSSSVNNNSGGGFHPSMPPTVTTTTTNSPSSTTGKKSSPGLRPLVPRRTVAPPPPLVPIGTTPSSVRSPPTLLPINEVVEKDLSAAKTTPSPTASNCKTVVESIVTRMDEDIKSDAASKPSDCEPVTAEQENQHSPRQENGKAEVDCGKVDALKILPSECSVSKTTSDNVNSELENQSDSKVEVAATTPS
ncbi:hypothetical protein OUZ56_009373 [Daphnia magna]|uniref:RING-type domain-containing protein n=1 Tax=Daphnia magna TaxID=35525 RepID=A0ABR0AG21_9CRUS|nr:hypothetical protein OUZ56_009373 [Daphnia magna]